MFTPPYILSTLLHHIALGGSRKGSFYLSLAMLLTAVVENLLINYYFHILYRMSLHMKSEMITNIYEKSLRVTSAVKSELGVGAIVNLQSNDASKIWNIPLYLHIVWNGPFQIFVVMALLVRIMGWAPAMAGLAVTVVMIPLSTLVGKSLGTARRAMVKQTDARVKLATEIITGIKAIKLYAWEKPYEERIHQLREQELVHIRYTQMLSMLNTAVFQSGPVLVSLAAFGVHSAMGYSLTAAVAFPALALFNLLRFPIIMFPSQIMNMINARVGLQRIQKFLEADEMVGRGTDDSSSGSDNPFALLAPERALSPTHQLLTSAINTAADKDQDVVPLLPKANGQALPANGHANGHSSELNGHVGGMVSPDPRHMGHLVAGGEAVVEEDIAVEVQGGTFAWERSKQPVISGLDLAVLRGQLVMVVGQVGSGKSSLLAALLGEMHRAAGHVKVHGSVAYTAQDPWVQNCTLRANVLLGRAYDDELYTSVLAACALGPDLEVLAAGDATEIGEKGVNLSGGQKHRVALARAAYSGADIYLLDDPLSAVDAHVGRHLFDMCLCGLLAGSTRILVTHQLQYVDAADVVVVMSDGKVADLGTHKELKARGVDLNKFVKANSDAPTLPAPVPIPPSPPQTIQPEPQPQQTQPQPQPQPSALELIDLSRDSMKPSAGSARGSEAGVDQGSGALQLHGPSSSTSVSAGVSRTSSFSVGRRSVTGSRGPGLLRGEELVRSAAARRAASVQELTALRAALRRTLELKERDGKIVKVEERAVGQVARAVYRAYLGAWASAWVLLPAAVVLLAFSERGLQVGQNYVLSWWSNDTQDAAALGRKPHTKRWLTLYVMLGLISIGLQLVRAVMTITGAITASRQLHKQLMSKVVRLPMSFYDSQPTGRLLNRLTKDTEAVDVQVSGSVNMALICLVNALLSILVVSLVSPVALVALGPMSLLYYRIQAVYIATSRELKRLDSLAFSPIFQHFSESLQGLMSIRAFDKQALFIGQNKHNLNTSNRAYWPIQVVNRWLSVRLELMGAAIVFVTAVCVTVIMPASSGLVGLAISSALNLTGIMNWMVRQMTELEVNMNSVERMTEYLKYEEEAAAEVPGKQPPAGWPHAGAIEVRDLTVRYRPDLDPVLRSLSFSVRGCEKVGVCGRTGCGKSTLMITLYRLVEPCGGAIIIDGVDVAAIGLRDLRSRLSLVPQDPVIFSGTLRSNLDPFGAASGDAAIWEAVRRASLTDFVRGLDGGLDAVIKEGGANLSVGQRQLLCMARALLRASRILVLDEATSNVDNATDNLIQATIRSAFADCTVLTIAHRLHTIIDSDRILLLDAGKLAEFESPAVLLQRPGGAFRKLVEETTKGGGLNADAVQHALSAATQAAGSAP
ncbi:P-loop containing nucleoside triphosphate hydrolase protein [Haematococcus lacustris]